MSINCAGEVSGKVQKNITIKNVANLLSVGQIVKKTRFGHHTSNGCRDGISTRRFA